MPFGHPFRAISLCVSFPGLKPWAVFCSPVGRLELAQENVQTPGQARSAWSHEENSPVPAGRLNGSRFRLDASSKNGSGIAFDALSLAHAVPQFRRQISLD